MYSHKSFSFCFRSISKNVWRSQGKNCVRATFQGPNFVGNPIHNLRKLSSTRKQQTRSRKTRWGVFAPRSLALHNIYKYEEYIILEYRSLNQVSQTTLMNLFLHPCRTRHQTGTSHTGTNPATKSPTQDKSVNEVWEDGKNHKNPRAKCNSWPWVENSRSHII